KQFGAFTYRLKVCRQLSIVFRCLMKQQCICRFKFQRHCLIELELAQLLPMYRPMQAFI
ncbi:DUF3709 domain-containing protein, partial [Vibrio cholerae]|uniref:DUF3709 domain-containing protein n=1 Tax=Vibrio cholerae TaxID=666 RepID=UPI003454BA5E